jgi:hypothetical protein
LREQDESELQEETVKTVASIVWFVLMLTLIVGMPVTAAPPVHSVSGGGSVVIPPNSNPDCPDGARSNYTFQAQQLSDGSVRGNAQLQARCSGVTVHMEVFCLEVDGNEAWLTGEVTHIQPKELQGLLGLELTWRVQDSGPGRSAGPDWFSDRFYGIDESGYCNERPDLPLEEWTYGNIRVK